MYNLIEDYLDRLMLPLVHRLPYHERLRIRQEMRDHLLERTQDLQQQGVSADEAVTIAIKQFGPPEWVGTLLLEKRLPLPALNWWRALLLVAIIVAVSASIVLPVPWRTDDARQQQVVDVMLWTAGMEVMQHPASAELQRALNAFTPFGVLTIPLHSSPALPDASLRPLHDMVRNGYGSWLEEVMRPQPPPRIITYEWPQPGIPVRVVRVPLTYSVCGNGCLEQRRLPSATTLTAWTAGMLMLAAFVSGLLMRRWRWVAGTVALALVATILWSAVQSVQITSEAQRQIWRSQQVGQVVRSLEDIARKHPEVIQSSPPRLRAEQLALSGSESRAQRILRLAELFRFYQSDYQRLWGEWQQAGIGGQVWRLLSVVLVPAWWSLPCAVLAVVAGGWLGILVGVWSWRLRRYLVYRYA